MYRTALKNEVSISELNYLRDQQMSNTEIAKKLGVSPATISKYLLSNRKKRAKLNEKDKNEIFELWREGELVANIAETYNCSVVTIYRLLKDRGISLRGKKSEKEEKVEDILPEPKPKEVKSGNLQQRTVSIFYGRLGEYVIDTEKNCLLAQPHIDVFDKEHIFNYIRDLMIVWKEM